GEPQAGRACVRSGRRHAESQGQGSEGVAGNSGSRLALVIPPPPTHPSPTRGEGFSGSLPPCGGGLGWGVWRWPTTCVRNNCHTPRKPVCGPCQLIGAPDGECLAPG